MKGKQPINAAQARRYVLQALIVVLACVTCGCDFSFDEAGNGSLYFSFLSSTAIPETGTLRVDPGPGGGSATLFYPIGSIVAGDVLITDPTGARSDLLRFDGFQGGVFVYSADTGALGDRPLPTTFQSNMITLVETGTGSVTYTPTSGQPGFLSLAVEPITYHFQSSASSVTAVALSALDIPFQVKIFPNLSAGDSVINIGNTGASGVLQMTGSPVSALSIGGNLCVNVYAFSPDEQEVACCSCLITPNGVVTTSARQLISKTLTPAVPTAITVKLLATDGSTGTCNAGALTLPMPGLLAFGTNIHLAAGGGSNGPGTYAVTETPFTPATLSSAEATRIVTLCGFIQSNGTGFGVCPGCSVGAAGAARQ